MIAGSEVEKVLNPGNLVPRNYFGPLLKISQKRLRFND